jgi:hypothetical protein
MNNKLYFPFLKNPALIICKLALRSEDQLSGDTVRETAVYIFPTEKHVLNFSEFLSVYITACGSLTSPWVLFVSLLR